jgi:hypothetical protein
VTMSFGADNSRPTALPPGQPSAAQPPRDYCPSGGMRYRVASRSLIVCYLLLGCHRDAQHAASPDTASTAAATVPQDSSSHSCTDSSATGAAAMRGSAFAAEARSMSGAPTHISRLGRVLSITLGSGAVVSLRDCTAEGDSYITYRYQYFDRVLRAHVIDVGYYEGGSTLLVSDGTGRQFWTIGAPIVSPDSQSFLTWAFDVESGEDPNGLQIWRIDADSLTMVLNLEPDLSWGPSGPRWLSPTLVEWWRLDATGGDVTDSTKMYAVLRAGTWDTTSVRP